MKASSDHIATSHVGSLPRPDGLIAALARTKPANRSTTRRINRRSARRWRRSCERQRDIGIDIPGDGEFGKPMAQRVKYGSWWRYSWQRLGGLDFPGPSPSRRRRDGPAPARSC